jgi:hypothetical protein
MISNVPVPDVFVSGLGEVWEIGGGCYRFVFFVNRPGSDERAVAARLIAPLEAVPPALLMAAKAVGFSMAAGSYFPRAGLH